MNLTAPATASALASMGIAARVRNLGVKFRVCLKSGDSTTAEQRVALANALNGLGFCSVVGTTLEPMCFNGRYEICAYLPTRIRRVA